MTKAARWRVRLPRGRDSYPFVILVGAGLALMIVPIIAGRGLAIANLYDIGQTFADYGLLTLGLGLAMIAGEYDISTLGCYAAGGVIAAKLGGGGPLVGLGGALAVGLLAGLLQGTIVSRLEISAIPVTLGGYLVLFGVLQVVSGSTTVSFPNISFSNALNNPLLGIFSLRTLISFAVFASVWILMRFTRIGVEVRAVGGDRRASRTAGVPVARTLIGVFIAAGLLSAAAGALTDFSLGAADPSIGLTPLIYATIAVLLGGVSVYGGRGSAGGIAAGVLSYAALSEIVGIVGAPEYVSDLVIGVVLTIAGVVAAPGLGRPFQLARARIGAALASRR